MSLRLLSLSLFALSCFAGLSALGPAPLPVHAAESWWLSDYREALRTAKQTGKPIFVEFRCEP